MCGIAGIINLKNTTQQVRSLIDMTNNLYSRGPDNEGYLLFNDNANPYFGNDSIVKNTTDILSAINENFQVAFGFRQLKIIDLSNKSHQPMTDISKKYWIVFNGEIFNYKEIKKTLLSLGYQFVSNSDTEVVLNAYIEWGEKAVEFFNGMFAFSIFDSLKNEIFMARDRMGIKPFYYYKTQNQFVFASTIQSIIKSKIYKPEINWEGLWQNFRFSIAQRPNTSFKDIYALEAAHFLKINLNNSTFEKRKYWEIPTNTQDLSLTKKQSIELVEESLIKAVNYRLVSDVDVGTFMSGGIDSTLVSVLASKSKPNIKAMTLGFQEYKDFDEVQQAKDTAELHHLNHIIHYATSKDVLKNIKETSLAYEEPYHHLSANFVLANMASSNHLKVVLSGLGGDELFGGYDVFNKISLWENLRTKQNTLKFLPAIHQKIKKAKQIASYQTNGSYYSHYYTNFLDTEIQELFLNQSFTTENLLKETYNHSQKFTDTFDAMSFYSLKSYIGNHQMRAVDHSTMAFSVEGRFPLLDHNFIETAFKIPTKFKIYQGVQKYILKEIAKKHIAKSCIEMSKKGLSLPLKHWINTYLKDYVNDHLELLKNRNLFDKKTINRIQFSGNEIKIWQLVSTELWLQNFFD